MIEVKSPIRHNGRLYGSGSIISGITPEQATVLVDAGVADWQRVKPTSAAPMLVASEPVDAENWDVVVRQYHKGFGNYDIPGVGMVKGKEDAVEALKAARTEG